MANIIYTDGSCLGNPGNGGWSFLVKDSDHYFIVSGAEKNTTNNRMELMAIVKALEFATQQKYEIFTDSKLTLNCATGVWKRKANLDLWSEYDKLCKKYDLKWTWIKAHNGTEFNEIVDKAARDAAKSL